MKIKETKKLFYNKYPYKLRLFAPGSHYMRNYSNNLVFLSQILTLNHVKYRYNSDDDYTIESYDYIKSLIQHLKNIEDYKFRVEYNILSIYFENPYDMDQIKNINGSRVLDVFIPQIQLEPGQIVMSDTPYSYKVTIGTGKTDISDFMSWIDGNNNFKISDYAKRSIINVPRYSQYYFYVKDENNLLLTKMYIGNHINKIESIIQKPKTNA